MIWSVYFKHTLVCCFKFSSSLQQDEYCLRVDSVFVSFISWKKIVWKVIPTISFLCAFIVIVVVWTLLFFNIENDF